MGTTNIATRFARQDDLLRRTNDASKVEAQRAPKKVATPTPVRPKVATPDLSPNGSISSARTRRGDLDLRQQQLRQKVEASSSDGAKGMGQVAGKTSFSERVGARFGDWDANKDGFLSAQEIDTAMLDAKNQGDDAAALATLKRRYTTLETLSDDEWGPENDGVSKQDLDAYSKAAPDGQTEGAFNYFKSKIAGSSRELFANGTPDWTSIQQGNIGDCWFLSAAAAKTKADPEAVKKMIADNGDGTYTVSLPGKKPVTVQRPTDAELAYYASSGKDGLWAAILEKGYAQTRNDASWTGKTTLPQDQIDSGSLLNTGLNALSKGTADNDMLTITRMSTTRAKLDQAFADKRMVTAGIGNHLLTDDDEEILPDGHAYSIVGWDKKTDTVTIRNPWGRRELRGPDGKPLDGNDDGVFTMKLADFYKTFTNIAYEGK